jgi:prevent-host-death family protein
MKSISISNARSRLAELVEQVAYDKETVEITRRGKVLAVVIPPEDRALLDRLEDEADLQRLVKSRSDIKRQGTLGLDQVVPRSVLDRARNKHGPAH